MKYPIKKYLSWIFTLSLCGILPSFAQAGSTTAYDAVLQDLTLKCEANLKSLEGSEQLAEIKKACREYKGDHHLSPCNNPIFCGTVELRERACTVLKQKSPGESCGAIPLHGLPRM